MKIFILLFFISTILSYLVFPLSRESEEITSSDNHDDIIKKLSNCKMYITINIGSKNSYVKTFVTLSKTELIIAGKNIKNHQYDELESDSYCSYNEKVSFSVGPYAEGVFSAENFNINNGKNEIQTVNNISFILAIESKYDDASEGEIGLHLPFPQSYQEYNFINSLKKSNGTNSTNWYFDFDNFSKGEGKMVVDGFPDDLHNKKYNHNNFNSIYSLKKDYTIDWGLKFSDIYYDDSYSNINNDIEAHIVFDLGIIAAPEVSATMIEKYFFKKYLEEKICFKDIFGVYKEIFFYCKKTKQFDIKEFQSIYLRSKDLQIIFELDYNDLFYERNDYYYFLITFKKDNTVWRLGELFLKKYYIVFNQESKTVGYYRGMEKKKNKKPTESKFNIMILLIILIIILIIIIIFGIIFYIKNKKQRKNRANELDDDNYYYEPEKDSSEDKTNELVSNKININ